MEKFLHVPMIEDFKLKERSDIIKSSIVSLQSSIYVRVFAIWQPKRPLCQGLFVARQFQSQSPA